MTPTLIGLAMLAAAEAPFTAMPFELGPAPHPCVSLTSAEAGAVRARAAALPWAQAIAARTIAGAEALAAAPLDIPHAPGQWTHWYSCKACGGGLRAQSPTKHVCTKCGASYSGWPYDDVYVTQRHSHWLRGVETLGAAYLLDPRPEFAARVRDILLEYATFYRELELHDVNNKKGRGGRLYAQTLDESVTMCSVCLGYDLVYDAPCFSQADHAQIAEGLLRPVADTIMRNPRGISNWQSWHNAGVGSIGLLLRDHALADWAVNGKHGFLYQMAESLMDSGMWYEECPSYHFYALSAHVYLMEAAARAGLDLYAVPEVKGMFDAPIRQLLPDLTFVPLHDSDRSSILSQRRFYEVAYRRYGDPRYAQFIPERDSLWALFWGVDELPKNPGPLALPSSNDESEGLAVLRDTPAGVAVYLDYGPGRSGHVQPAKLNLVLYAFGDIRFVDPGRLPYGNPMHRGWFRQTVAHNTLVVDGRSQNRAPGRCIAYAAEDGAALCRAVCDRAYKGVRLDRTVCLHGDTVYDVFLAQAEAPAVFDLPLHLRGSLAELPAKSSCQALGDSDGYQHLENVAQFDALPGGVFLDCGDGNRIHAAFCGNAEAFYTEAFYAEGYGVRMAEKLPMIILRQQGLQAAFAAAYQMLAPGQAPAGPASFEPGPPAILRHGDLRLEIGQTTKLVVGETALALPGTPRD